ncbi:MAG TPA: sulfatase-like hydrolase/transferase, partial [Thermoanaerobaculia bacterium]|nr:sulfatase-like hydrolase/transferase [Thermoanaerobaculia bacterium]
MARALLRWPALLLASVFGLVGCSRAGLAEGPPAAPPDLILITIDTLRADAPSFAGVHPGTTPNLDRLAAKGRVFDNAHAHNVITLPSHTNILTGLYPYQHGVRENSGFKLRRDVPTLATYLKAAGYKTAAFVGAYPLDSEFGLDRGFDVYDDRFPKGSRPTEFVLPERRGDEVVRLALAWWQQQKGSRRFLWVHLFDPHAPYDPPEPFASKFAKEPYLGDVAAADSFLAPLLSPHLEGKEPPALIVVTGDHGEGLGEHGELTHGLFAYEPTLHVPLLLWGVGVPPGRDPRPARHVDILPTLLGAAGVKPPTAGASRLPGASLLGPAPSGLAADSYFESLSASLNRGWAPLRGVIRDGKKAILLPLPELYDLPRDPREASNLFDAERRLAATLLRSLPTESEWPPPRGAISEEEARRLAALGYITSTASTKPSFDVKDDPKRLVDLDRKIHDLVDLYSRGRLEEAVKLGEEVVKERPEMPLGYSLLAQALLEKGDTAAAVKLMQEARKGGRATESLLVQL